jgi:WD40 repeat protein
VYRAHLGEIAALAVSHDGARAATAGDDGTLKLFDVASFDMQTMARLSFLPSAASHACTTTFEVQSGRVTGFTRAGPDCD